MHFLKNILILAVLTINFLHGSDKIDNSLSVEERDFEARCAALLKETNIEAARAHILGIKDDTRRAISANGYITTELKSDKEFATERLNANTSVTPHNLNKSQSLQTKPTTDDKKPKKIEGKKTRRRHNPYDPEYAFGSLKSSTLPYVYWIPIPLMNAEEVAQEKQILLPKKHSSSVKKYHPYN